jgi:hypothetical protein
MSQTDVQFSTRAPARKAGRFTLVDARTVECGRHESVGVGVDRKGDQALVYESGQAQSGIPMHAVATAIAAGKVIPLAALAGALKETGQLDKLSKEIEKVGA